jgi:hypothetical protein
MVSLSEPQNLLFRVCTTLLLPLPYCPILMACFGGSNVAMRVIQHRSFWTACLTDVHRVAHCQHVLPACSLRHELGFCTVCLNYYCCGWSASQFMLLDSACSAKLLHVA